MSEREDNGLTLKGLAHRLEALERENSELRHKVATFDGKVSRRAILTKAAAAALAAAGAGMLLKPGEAEAGTTEFGDIDCNYLFANLVLVGGEYDYDESPAVLGAHTGRSLDDGVGVLGVGKGANHAGVKGTNQDGAGVWGRSAQTGYGGVFGQHIGSSGYGVIGDGKGQHAGVIGRNASNLGGEFEGKTGVKATGSDIGVIGIAPGTNGIGVGGLSASGSAVHGLGGDSGYGGSFAGGKAQLKLIPQGSAGKPTSGAHDKGEIYMDSTGALFVCTANGTPGTWSKITTTLAP